MPSWNTLSVKKKRERGIGGWAKSGAKRKGKLFPKWMRLVEERAVPESPGALRRREPGHVRGWE